MSDFEQHIQERMSRAYQRVFGSPANPGFGRPYMEPPVDIYHTDKEVVVLIEIAGIPEEEIELEVEGRSMIVRGRRKPIGGRPNRVYSQMEIMHGAFQRDLGRADARVDVVLKRHADQARHGILDLFLQSPFLSSEWADQSGCQQNEESREAPEQACHAFSSK